MPRVLVTGATGTFGGEVVRQLLAKGVAVRVLVRDSAKARRLSGALEVVVGDFDRAEALDAALTGIERVFLASFDSPRQAALQRQVLAAAKRHGVRHVARISTTNVQKLRHLPIFAWHYEGERQLERSGLGFTHLRAHWVMQNFLPSSTATPVVDGAIRLPAGTGRVHFVDARDVAAVAAVVLTEPGHEGQAYELTGAEALTHAEVAATLSAAAGRAIAYENISPAAYAQERGAQGWSQPAIETMLALFSLIRDGLDVDASGAIAKVTGRAPISFREFARDYAATFGAQD